MRLSAALLGVVITGGTLAYLLFGLSLLDALYQTITTMWPTSSTWVAS